MSKTFRGAPVLGLSLLLFCAGCGGKGSTALLPAAVQAKISVTDSVNPQNDSLVSFGTVAAGYSSMEAVVVTNSGSGTLTIGTVASSELLSAPFSIALDTCSGASLAPGSKCDLMLRFAPLSSGTFTGVFDIPSNDPDHPKTSVGVMGTGTYAVPVPHIVITDPVPPTDDHLLPFGTVNQGMVARRTVTIGNDGTVNLVVGQIGLVNPLAGPFAITTDGCSGKSIAPSTTCAVTVEFHPNSTGDFSSGFDIPSNDPAGSAGFYVTGTGVDLLSPTRLDFGNVAANQTADLALTLTNNGSADLVMGAIGALDPLAAPFSILADGCSGATLASAGTCQVTVRFAPTGDGSFSDSFDVPTSGGITGDFIVSVSGVSGTGTASGTITLPSASTGVCYAVVLTPSFSIIDPLQNATAVATGQTNGTTITYSLSGISPGQYYLYAGVDNDASSASPPACSFANGAPTKGDFVGFYGGGFPAGPNVTVSVGPNTFDFSLTTY